MRHFFFLGLALLLGAVDSAHVISDKDEAHHVTEQILKRQKGKKHSHQDVQELRDEFKMIQKSHFPNHDPKKRKSSISLTKEHARNMREATLRNEPGGMKSQSASEFKKDQHEAIKIARNAQREARKMKGAKKHS